MDFAVGGQTLRGLLRLMCNFLLLQLLCLSYPGQPQFTESRQAGIHRELGVKSYRDWPNPTQGQQDDASAEYLVRALYGHQASELMVRYPYPSCLFWSG